MAENEPLYSLPDSVLQRGIDQGQRTYQRQRYGRPQFGFPDISQDQVDRDRLFNALIGAGMGAQAGGQGLNPLAALAMGAGAGISAPQVGDLRAKRQAAQLSLQEEQLNQAPVGAVAPGMVQALQQKYGMDVSEIPMGQFQKFSGLLQRADDLEKQLLLISARGEQSRLSQRSGGAKEESRLRSELRTLTKDFRTVRDSFSKILSTSASPSAAGDLSMIFSYMRMLDPQSVVRESEQATAENARGVPESVRVQYNRILRGEKLSPAQRQDFISQARGLYNTQAATIGETRRQYRDLAERLGVNPENVDIDFGAGIDGGVMMRMARPKGSTGPLRPYISKDGGKTWEAQ